MLYHNVMPKRLGRNLCKLKKLSCVNKKQRCNVIKQSDRDFIKCLCECGHNILKGNIKINSKEKQELKKYKNTLRKLVFNKNSLNHQKKYLVQQKGGIIPLLISPILSILASLALNSFKQNG